MDHSYTPVIVGVAQVLNREADSAGLVEPVDLMLRASEAAEHDTGCKLLHRIESVRVIQGVWPYQNPARFIAGQIGCPDAQTVGTMFGGNYNQVVLNETADAIGRGDLELALITGAEIGRTMARARKAGSKVDFRELPGEYDQRFGKSQMPEHHDYEIEKGIRQAIQVYPMYENAIRHHRGESMPAHLERISELWARFSKVARQNPHAWLRDPVSAEDIRTPSASNRMVGFPYTKLMNANNAVDMGAALIVASTGKARSLGIPEDKWVYPWAGVEGKDHFSASVRDNFHSSPGIRLVGQRIFELVGRGPDEIDYVDLYSCFPSAVQIAAQELGFDESRDLTVTGGLTFGGGPLNNYVMHSIARMVELLRASPGKFGLVTANGGNLYKHAHCIYSGEPPPRDFKRDDVQAQIDALPARECLQSFEGSAEIESYTVMYGPEGPSIAHIACRNHDGRRIWANCADPDVMAAMGREEFCGRAAKLRGETISIV